MTESIDGMGKEGTIKPFGLHHIPEEAIPVATYAEYMSMVRRWSTGVMRSTLICLGAAGIGKTETALQAVEGLPHLYLKGDASRYGVYVQLYKHQNQLVLLDDLDEMLSDSGTTGLLKMLLETRDVKTIQRTTATGLRNEDEGEGVPSSFETTSRTLMLVNELRTVSKNFKAAMDRATLVWFCPSPAEVAKYVKTWFNMADDKDVYDFVTERLPLAAEPSCRFYYKAQDWKHAGLDWKSLTERRMRPSDERMAFVAALEADTTVKTVKERIAKFTERYGQSGVTYHAIKKKLGINHGRLTPKQIAQSKATKGKPKKRKA